jgi:mannose-1-phosphate guanylyltransferase
LAAGDGSRLRSLTTIAPGASIPKQFCSLRPGPSLLDHTLTRAIAVSGRKRTCAIVSADHRRWWEPLPRRIPAQNIVIQRLNRGTATGILLPLLQILERDSDASVVFLPSDHFVQREMVLQRSMRKAVQLSRRDRDSIILLGFDPDSPDTQLGYIVPNGNPVDDVANVERFVEKPSITQTRHLIKQGGLWNAFILAAKGTALLNLFRARMAAVVEALHSAVRKDMTTHAQWSFTDQLYRDLPSVDFSRDVLPGQESSIKVIRVPHCGWSDLGTPERIGITLRRMQPQYDHIGPNNMIGLLVLARQYKQRYRTSSYVSDD